MSTFHRLFPIRRARLAAALLVVLAACDDLRTVTPSQRSGDAARDAVDRGVDDARSTEVSAGDARPEGRPDGADGDRIARVADARQAGDAAGSQRPDGADAPDAPGPVDARPADAGLAADSTLPEQRPHDARAVDGPRPDVPAGEDARTSPPDAIAGPDGPRHHPPGYDAPAVHGAELRLGADDCRRCHGERLAGDTAPGCDACHAPGWRTNCVYCHGGVETQTGAPPRDLNDEVDPARIRFGAHTVHTSGARSPFFGCDECHRRPADVLSAGHVFDDTPGRAEIDFSGGLSLSGAYPGNGQCNSLYCHGNGAITGNVTLDAPPMDCQSCHPAARLIGLHARHLVQGALGCHDCHARTTDAPDHILDPALHVNGQIDVAIATPTLVEVGRQCTGMCHGEDHPRRVW